MNINKRSADPLYYQIAELIQERIQTGEWQPGTRLPSERKLSEQLQVSRMTVRQAVAYLVREGALTVKPGVGTSVARPKLTYDAMHLIGFTENMMQQGEMPASHVLDQQIVIPPRQIFKELSLAPLDTTTKILCLRLAGDIPLLLETIFIPTALCPDLVNAQLENESLYRVLEEQYGLQPTQARQTLESTIAGEFEAQLFDTEVGRPMLLLKGITVHKEDRPVEYFKAICRGDRYKFAFESHRNGVKIKAIVR